jgi:hypothetical protein
MEDLIHRAREFARAAHRDVGQLRKYSGQPYEEHLRRVAEIVSSVSDDAAMIAAAWLHDVVEDTPVTIETLTRTFGTEVGALVNALSDVSRPHHGNRAARKALDREHLARACPRAQTVKLADLIDNCQDICSHNPRFGRVFIAEMAALLDVLTEGDRRLQRRARSIVDKWTARLSKAAQAPVPARDRAADIVGPRARRALRLFASAFCAGDVAEPLPAAEADHAAVGSIRSTQLVDRKASLADVVTVLTRHDFCFVADNGKVTHRVGRDEMQGPVGRMWLFGIITSIELAATERIRALADEPKWSTLVTPARLEKARVLQRERAALGRRMPLLDCLQLSDKIRILLAIDDQPRPLFQGSSKAETQRLVRDLEELRNSLAHAQDIVTHDWVQIARLANRLHDLASAQDAIGEVC